MLLFLAYHSIPRLAIANLSYYLKRYTSNRMINIIARTPNNIFIQRILLGPISNASSALIVKISSVTTAPPITCIHEL